MTLVTVSPTLNRLPPHLALSEGGGCTSCERKLTEATAGDEDAPSLPLCSLQLTDAGSLLPLGLLTQCKPQVCHWELHRSPVCRWALRRAQLRLATFTPSLNPTKLHGADGDRERHGQEHWGVDLLKETDNLVTGGF